MNSSILIQMSAEDLEALIRRVFISHLGEKDNTASPPELPIDEPELCRRLNISRQTARVWRDKKKIPFFKIGGLVRYDWSTVMECLQKKGGRL